MFYVTSWSNTVVVPPYQLNVASTHSSALTNQSLFGGVEGLDCGSSSVTEGSAAVVHHACIVIRQAVVVDHGSVVFMKVSFFVLRNIFPEDPDMTVSIGAALMVVDSEGVEKLVLNDPRVHAASRLKTQVLECPGLVTYI